MSDKYDNIFFNFRLSNKAASRCVNRWVLFDARTTWWRIQWRERSESTESLLLLRQVETVNAWSAVELRRGTTSAPFYERPLYTIRAKQWPRTFLVESEVRTLESRNISSSSLSSSIVVDDKIELIRLAVSQVGCPNARLPWIAVYPLRRQKKSKPA